MSSDNALSQLEETWKKPRNEWQCEEWQRAAESLERALSASVKLLTMQAKAIDDAHRLLRELPRQSKPARRGRPPKQRGLDSVTRKKPLSERHLNFGIRSKYDYATKFVLIAKVKSEIIRASRTGKKLSAKDALFNIFKSLPEYKSKREASVYAEVRSRLSPMLSRFKKELQEIDRDFETAIETVATKWAE